MLDRLEGERRESLHRALSEREAERRRRHVGLADFGAEVMLDARASNAISAVE